MEANKQSNIADELFSDTDALSCCPAMVQGFVGELSGSYYKAPRVGATGMALALAAATMGPSARVVVGNQRPLTAGFNILIAHTAP